MFDRLHRLSLWFAAAMVFLMAISASAQLDPGFGNAGITTTDIDGGQDGPVKAFPLPDGKILVLALSAPGDNAARNYSLIRYSADGVIDTTYGTGGIANISIPFLIHNADRGIQDAVRQSDGKIVLAGYDGQDGIVVRVNEDGTIDSSFASSGVHRPNINGTGPDGVNALTIQSDGGIVGLGGVPNGYFLIRYLTNGSVDTSFGNNGFGYIVHSGIFQTKTILIQSSGKFIAGGGNAIRRFNTNGSIDNSFAVIQPASSCQFALQSDDKVVVSRNVVRQVPLDIGNFDYEVSRYDSNGNIDTSFGTEGSSTFDGASNQDDSTSALKILPDGHIIIGGVIYIGPNRSVFRNGTFSLVKLSSTGVVEGRYLVRNNAQPLNTYFTPRDYDVIRQADGKLVLVTGKVTLVGGSADVSLFRVSDVPLTKYLFHAIPFDFQLTGKTLPTVFRPDDRKWYLNSVYPGTEFGLAGDIPVSADYAGDFRPEFSTYRPSTGVWYIAKPNANPATNFSAIQFGVNGDIPMPADFDGDGKTDVALFRPSTGAWYIRNSETLSVTALYWGLNGDKPAAGDFDGDGKADVAVFRPSNGYWYVLKSSNGQAEFTSFGLNGDVPVQEDYDGDGKTDIAVWRPSSGVWFRINSSDGSVGGMAWGLPTDIAVPGDYDGDLKTDIAVWRPSEGRWYTFTSSTNQLSVYFWGTQHRYSCSGPVLGSRHLML